MEKFSKKTTKIIGILIIITWTIGSILFSFYLLPTLPNLDKDQKTFFFTLAFSSFGIVFIYLKRKGLNPYSIESFELLFIMILPTIALIPLLTEPKIYLTSFLFIYPGVVIIWFFLAKNLIVGKISDVKERENALSSVKLTWGYLMALLIPIMVLYIGVIFPFFINDS